MAQSRPHYVRIEIVRISSLGRLALLISAEGNPDDVASVVLGDEETKKIIRAVIDNQPQLLMNCALDSFRDSVAEAVTQALGPPA